MGLFSFLKDAGSKIFAPSGAPTTRRARANTSGGSPDFDLGDSEAAKKAEAVANRQKLIVLRGVVNSLGLKVEDLDVNFDDDTVTVYGSVDSQADKEKIVLALGNVAGVAAVDDRMTVENPEPEATMYEVKRGDSLSKIAKAHYGDAMKYKIIFEANTPMLKDPNKIYPGQMLRIPALD
ncbi:MAG: peptidoglycan-binding protein LysM [Bacteroidota bacterium]